MRNYGPDNGRRICQRLVQLMAAENLETLRFLPQLRAHELSGDRAGQISVDVKHPRRLLIMSDHEETPRKRDGLDARYESKDSRHRRDTLNDMKTTVEPNFEVAPG